MWYLGDIDHWKRRHFFVDEDICQNEDDLIASVQTISHAMIAFTVSQSTGILCAVVDQCRAGSLRRPPTCPTTKILTPLPSRSRVMPDTAGRVGRRLIAV